MNLKLHRHLKALPALALLFCMLPALTVSAQPESIRRSSVPIRSVRSTSTLRNYTADKACDLDTSTAWFESAKDTGAGEGLTFSVSSSRITAMGILPGYVKNETVYTENCTIKRVLIHSGRVWKSVDVSAFVPDFANPQPLIISFPTPIPVEDGKVTVSILEAVPGTRSSHTGISEVFFLTDERPEEETYAAAAGTPADLLPALSLTADEFFALFPDFTSSEEFSLPEGNILRIGASCPLEDGGEAAVQADLQVSAAGTISSVLLDDAFDPAGTRFCTILGIAPGTSYSEARLLLAQQGYSIESEYALDGPGASQGCICTGENGTKITLQAEPGPDGIVRMVRASLVP